ncbi:hypothetical protein HPB47_021302 [Ixodes persulcatus]|uniref:Uncharacterized protein n=1 Tax=Ixodes persulcatus TaxID=34615 RepID=A0AC60QFG4_IXOPE|nr:hypothetical protein HPB47_021302 [Ixodes persulcatus]
MAICQSKELSRLVLKSPYEALLTQLGNLFWAPFVTVPAVICHGGLSNHPPTSAPHPCQVETDTTATATPIENGSSDEAETVPKGSAPESGAPSCTEAGGGVPGVAKAGVPRAILTCRPNSHPFPERILSLDQPAKVGRSVARCRQAHNNAIFDCKVLSRNHALLWYDNGKASGICFPLRLFYLQDTKSSNGTFVNNQRLSKGSEESPAQEVCSGDIVQFGVDVVENSRKGRPRSIIPVVRA